MAVDSVFSGGFAGAGEPGPRPRLLVTAKETEGLRSVAALRAAVHLPEVKPLWEQVRGIADRAVGEAPLTAFARLPGRSAEDIRQGNREFGITHEVGQRVLACALACLIADDGKYKGAALGQVKTLFDESAWPEWQDIYHRRRLGLDADLRTGQLCRDLGLAYDYLYPCMTEEECAWYVDGIDRRGIQPYLRAVEAGAPWVDRMNNWTTCIVGGLGLCGMALNEDHPQSQRLIDLALPRMRTYLEHYGPDGEFNECPSYASSSSFPVLFFSVYRYFLGERHVSQEIGFFRKHCIWQMYATIPPGEVVPFGDGGRTIFRTFRFSRRLRRPRAIRCSSGSTLSMRGSLGFHAGNCCGWIPLWHRVRLNRRGCRWGGPMAHIAI